MSYPLVVGIAFGLAMDALAVSIASGIFIQEMTPRHVFRLAFHFGLFQALMPIIGWLAGTGFAAHIVEWDHWVAFGLLTFLGGKMALDGIREAAPELSRDPSRGFMMVSLALATSIDALAVGLSFAMLNIDIWVPCLIIGVITGALSMFGVLFGNRIGHRWRRSAALLGGLVLILIGTKILLSHTLGL